MQNSGAVLRVPCQTGILAIYQEQKRKAQEKLWQVFQIQPGHSSWHLTASSWLVFLGLPSAFINPQNTHANSHFLGQTFQDLFNIFKSFCEKLTKNEGKLKGTSLGNFNKNLKTANPTSIPYCPSLESIYSKSSHVISRFWNFKRKPGLNKPVLQTRRIDRNKLHSYYLTNNCKETTLTLTETMSLEGLLCTENRWSLFKGKCLGHRHVVNSQFLSRVAFMFPIHDCGVRFLVWSLCLFTDTLFNVHLWLVAEEPTATSTHAICSPGDITAMAEAPPDSRHAAQRSGAFQTATSPSRSLHKNNSSILWQKFGISHFTKLQKRSPWRWERDPCVQYEGSVSAYWASAGNQHAGRGRLLSLFAGTCREWLNVLRVLIMGLQVDFSEGRTCKYGICEGGGLAVLAQPESNRVRLTNAGSSCSCISKCTTLWKLRRLMILLKDSHVLGSINAVICSLTL